MRRTDILKKSKLTVVAARPGMGRVASLCGTAKERSIQQKVLYVSLALPERLLSGKYGLSRHNITIEERYPITFDELEEIIRNAVKNHNIKTVVIDYLNLLSGSNPDIVLSSLKSWAKELNLEIIAGVSVKRDKFKGIVSAPTIDNIEMKGTEAIDEFIPLHNPEYYLPM